MQNELTYEQVKKHVEMDCEYTGKDTFKKMVDLERRGVVLTPMQANLMFVKRGYGKTFMEYCRVLAENSTREYFTVSTKTAERDEDSHYLSIHGKMDWLRGFRDFMEKYGKDFKVRNERQIEIVYEKVR